MALKEIPLWHLKAQLFAKIKINFWNKNLDYWKHLCWLFNNWHEYHLISMVNFGACLMVTVYKKAYIITPLSGYESNVKWHIVRHWAYWEELAMKKAAGSRSAWRDVKASKLAKHLKVCNLNERKNFA